VLTDYHTHTYRCGHAVGRLEEYVEAAIARGIGELGLTDHLFLYFLDAADRNDEWAIREEEYDAHYDEMLAVRERYRDKLNVRVSVEADFVAGHETALAQLLARYEFDYILGSVHFVDGWLIDDPATAHRYDEQSVADVYERYYAALQQAIERAPFDLIAHFDLPKKFGHRPERDVTPHVLRTLDAVVARGIAIEVSSAGLRKPAGEIYPSPSILAEMRRRDVPIALSSDAHKPTEVGAHYDTLLKAVATAGYRELVVFDRRERRTQPIG
jgi:histidinol-phosphatase (PHP family)